MKRIVFIIALAVSGALISYCAVAFTGNEREDAASCCKYLRSENCNPRGGAENCDHIFECNGKEVSYAGRTRKDAQTMCESDCCP